MIVRIVLAVVIVLAGSWGINAVVTLDDTAQILVGLPLGAAAWLVLLGIDGPFGEDPYR